MQNYLGQEEVDKERMTQKKARHLTKELARKYLGCGIWN